jgi:dolichol-phosphate mannosyltransferase
MFTNNSLAIVIPTLNEQGNIGGLLSRLLANQNVGWIVVVDDGSNDGTVKEVRAVQEKDGRVLLVERQNSPSFSGSYLEGFTQALRLGAQKIVQMDADGSHQVADLDRLLVALEKSDLVIGSRYTKNGRLEGWTFWRRLVSRIGNQYARLILGATIRDLTSGFNGWRAEALKKVLTEELVFDGYVFQIWLKYSAINQGCSVVEVPIVFRDRKIGISKFSSLIIVESLIGVWKMRFQRFENQVAKNQSAD